MKIDKKTGGIIAGLLAVIVVLLVVLVLRKPQEVDPEKLKIGYAAEGVVVLDEESLRKGIEDMMANQDEIALLYKNDASSTDGVNFDCYIGNSALNTTDIYIEIFADSEMTDRIFLSKLLRPGTRFETIALEHPLEPGSHQVYASFTQVDTVDGELTAVGNAVVTLMFYVSGS